MVMISAEIPNLALDNLPVNWFDGWFWDVDHRLVLGRKHGMTKEILPLLKWVSLVVVCGIWYPLAAQLLVNTVQLSQVPSCIIGYLLLAFVVVLVLCFSNGCWPSPGRKGLFGRWRILSGMLSGMIRFACMLLPCWLAERAVYTAQDIKTRSLRETVVRRRICIAAIFPQFVHHPGADLHQILRRALHQRLPGTVADRNRSAAGSRAGEKTAVLTSRSKRRVAKQAWPARFPRNPRTHPRRHDIVDIIGSYLPLKKAGTNFTASAPFTRKRRPASTSST